MTRTRPIAGFLLTLAATLFLAAPAVAQDADVQTPPADDTSSDETPAADDSEFILDFGDSVVIEEDGSIRWNVGADNEVAEPGAATEPTPIPEGGVAGTGSLETDAPGAPTSSGGSSSGPREALDGSNAAGSGNRTSMLLGIVGLAIAAGMGGFFFVRSRRTQADDEAVVEDVVDINAGLMGDPSIPNPAAYQGAADAGAYQEGGAAYAQYAEPSYQAAAAETTTGSGPRNKLDQLRMSMSDIAEKKLVDSGQDRLIAKKLEAAGSQMRPGEWLVMAVGGTVGALFVATFVLGWLIGIIAAALTAVAFWMLLSVQEGKRQQAFADDLPETLQLLAGSLRGGLSMMQAIDTVAQEADDPTASEFQRVITESRLGRDLAVSFKDLAIRMDSKDFAWVVTAIEIHREVGGDLASIMDRVGDTIRARNRVRGQVQALSAEGRVSGLILFLLPPGMVLVIAAGNRSYLNEMLNESEGQIMLVLSAILLLAGGAWLKRLARFVY